MTRPGDHLPGRTQLLYPPGLLRVGLVFIQGYHALVMPGDEQVDGVANRGDDPDVGPSEQDGGDGARRAQVHDRGFPAELGWLSVDEKTIIAFRSLDCAFFSILKGEIVRFLDRGRGTVPGGAGVFCKSRWCPHFGAPTMTKSGAGSGQFSSSPARKAGYLPLNSGLPGSEGSVPKVVAAGVYSEG